MRFQPSPPQPPSAFDFNAVWRIFFANSLSLSYLSAIYTITSLTPNILASLFTSLLFIKIFSSFIFFSFCCLSLNTLQSYNDFSNPPNFFAIFSQFFRNCLIYYSFSFCTSCRFCLAYFISSFSVISVVCFL